ncbi:isoprenoid biosynthesis glyoxalase ElbB [Pararhodospirillum oryzae]|uniref:Isoprenoid biosynthesis protein ElbB n=1 Tax=Pararhodospirillum oryzae TaxID=478448 RepID=A0A512HAB8_9PROT|nr:isoprenoid biosynthesis glyoxalase ElbB [Pararhodospirillum oryzae]GEO82385.1 isoprenoid biosynthesis protein ElbB [Pararhodospirillum oryzae]
MTHKPRFAVFLSGCGVFDGAEIHESVLSLLAIDRHGGTYQCFAPDIPQHHVIDHRTGQPTGETRNVLSEAARIARGAIADLATFDPAAFDIVLLPGGFGVAKNFCTFAFDGPACAVDPTVEAAIRAAHAAGLPIGALCIAPALIARILGPVTVTIGQDEGTAKAIQSLGATHRAARPTEVVVDPDTRVVTTPCYMLNSSISQIADGADGAVRALIELLPRP